MLKKGEVKMTSVPLESIHKMLKDRLSKSANSSSKCNIYLNHRIRFFNPIGFNSPDPWVVKRYNSGMKSQHIHKSHNKTLLLYHMIFPEKYRRKVFDMAVDETLKKTCIEISERYEINFVEIGNDEDHVHFLIQSVPTLSVTKIVSTIKSITARAIFENHKEVKKLLWGGSLWSSGFYVNTVGQYANEDMIIQYVKNQGKKYTKLHQGQLKIEL